MAKAGDSFRDTLRDILVAAGYQNVKTEHSVGGKVVDVYAERPGDFSVQCFAFEAKDYSSNTLPLGQVTAFIHDYARLARNGSIDRAILVSKSPLTPDGRTAIAADAPFVVALTFEEFQRGIFGPDQYLAKLSAEYDDSGIGSFYVPTRTETGLLDAEVASWLLTDSAMPLVVLGGYGTGKSTYALHLANKLAAEAVSNPAARIPIRITLGNLVQQNNLEGLFGEHFTSKYTIVSPSWQLLLQLNRQGRFLIIFDGFDEMKHGMTFHDFERQFELLLTLAVGRAKVLILGRDTAFRDDREFRAIIHGRKITASGTEYQDTKRPDCRYVTLSPFTRDEAQTFIRGYFGYLVTQDRLEAQPWVNSRLDALLGPIFAELTLRPVHAQMLCRLAVDPQRDLSVLDQFSLYDAFIDYLIRREVEKSGRYSGFSIPVRRKANAALSWWLLANSGATSTTLRDAPSILFTKIVPDSEHNFSEAELVAELTAGCLVAKGIDTIYFGHRSIQEFLGAEHLFDVAYEPPSSQVYFAEEICRAATSEVVVYLREFFDRRADSKDVADAAIVQFLAYRGPIRLNSVGPYLAAVGHASGEITSQSAAHLVWLKWIERFGTVDVEIDTDKAAWLTDAMRRASSPQELLAVAFLVATTGHRVQNDASTFDKAPLLASFIDAEAMRILVDDARHKRRSNVNSDANLKSYLLVESFLAELKDEVFVKLDAVRLGRIVLDLLRVRPVIDTIPHFERRGSLGYLYAPRQRLLNLAVSDTRALATAERNALTWYFDPANNRKLHGVVVEASTRAPKVKPSERRLSRRS